MTPTVAREPVGASARNLRVMLVDDAVIVRGLYSRWVSAEPDLDVVATVRSGREAVDRIEHADPDVVVLDVEMPDMDGLTALPLLLRKKRGLVVIMASTLTRRNAEVSLRALSLGATDYVAKPQSKDPLGGASSFRRELIDKIRALGQRARARQRLKVARGATFDRLPTVGQAPPLVPRQTPYALRPLPRTAPRVLAIGSSTGGPQALTELLRHLGGVIDRVPVLITQHMPPTFTTILAEHLSRASGRPAREAQDGEAIDAGTIYVAPGAKHMLVERRDGTAVIAIDDSPPVNFCKPAVDPMFTSAAALWGHWLLGLVLTGMGSDGLSGAEAIVNAGGSVLAQDEASSVVWGMPGQVTNAGLASAVMPLDQIGATISRLFGERA